MQCNYAERLKTLRGERSRRKVAKDLNLSVSAIQMYENAERVPKDAVKIALANYYHSTVQEIFYD